MLSRLSGYSVYLVESSGTPISRLFSLDLSSGRCHRADCIVCELHSRSFSSKCKRNSIVYESQCQLCLKSNSNKGLYVGESGRTLYERSLEHLYDAAEQKTSSHIFKHWALEHPFQIVTSHDLRTVLTATLFVSSHPCFFKVSK